MALGTTQNLDAFNIIERRTIGGDIRLRYSVHIELNPCRTKKLGIGNPSHRNDVPIGLDAIGIDVEIGGKTG